MTCVAKENDETECERCIEGWRVDTNKNCEGEYSLTRHLLVVKGGLG